MKTVSRCFLLFALTSSATPAETASGLLRRSDEWMPYVERAQVDEVAILDQQIGAPSSKNASLVLYCCDDKNKLHLVYSLQEYGDDYRLEQIRLDPDEGQPSKKAIRLPRDVAARALDCFESVLEKQVFPPAGLGDSAPAAGGDVIWIYLHLDGNRVALGKVKTPFMRCWVGAPQSKAAFMRVWQQLGYTIDGQKTFEGYSPITQLDIAVSNLRLSYPSRK